MRWAGGFGRMDKGWARGGTRLETSGEVVALVLQGVALQAFRSRHRSAALSQLWSTSCERASDVGQYPPKSVPQGVDSQPDLADVVRCLSNIGRIRGKLVRFGPVLVEIGRFRRVRPKPAELASGSTDTSSDSDKSGPDRPSLLRYWTNFEPFRRNSAGYRRHFCPMSAEFGRGSTKFYDFGQNVDNPSSGTRSTTEQLLSNIVDNTRAMGYIRVRLQGIGYLAVALVASKKPDIRCMLREQERDSGGRKGVRYGGEHAEFGKHQDSTNART